MERECMEQREFWGFDAALGKWEQPPKPWIGIHPPSRDGMSLVNYSQTPMLERNQGSRSRCSLPCCNSTGFTFPGSRPSSPGYLWLLPEHPYGIW